VTARGAALLSLAVSMTAGAGCARALREPPPLIEPGLPGAGPHTDDGQHPERVDPLLARADVLYAARGPADVRQAADVYLEAARADITRLEGLVGAVRARTWLIDHEADAEQRRRDAVGAVQAAQWCVGIQPDSAVCSYWMGAALGLQARERHATALDALPRIEQAFQKAAAGDPTLEQGGPDRALALLYLRAPGWPTGPGDPEKGLVHARKAVELGRDYPPNHLALAEALAANGDAEGGRQGWSRALELARAMKDAGDRDAIEWIQEAETALAGAPSER